MHCKATIERKSEKREWAADSHSNQNQCRDSKSAFFEMSTTQCNSFCRVIKQGHVGGQFCNWAKIMWRISDPNSATDSYSVQEKAELPLIHTQQQHIMMIFGWYGWYLEYRKDKWVIFGLQDIRQRKNGDGQGIYWLFQLSQPALLWESKVQNRKETESGLVLVYKL